MQLLLGTTMMTGTDIYLQPTDDNVSMLCIFAKKNRRERSLSGESFTMLASARILRDDDEWLTPAGA